MSPSYTREITVSATPEAAYKALTTDFNKWWTIDCNPIHKSGDTITFRFGPSYWKMQAIKLEPSKQVELKCIEAHHIHAGLHLPILDEWEGTTLEWQIEQSTDKTVITLTHEGLVPSLNCYEICEQGWDYFFVSSLKQYLDTGKGMPFEDIE
jgi:uncharacterized protein YndB with AHSA1/START domain